MKLEKKIKKRTKKTEATWLLRDHVYEIMITP
jgi:hypothetical protein